MPSLPATLPHHMDQLIEELDTLNPAPVVTGPVTTAEEIQTMVFAAGRRSIVEELIRLKEKAQNG